MASFACLSLGAAATSALWCRLYGILLLDGQAIGQDLAGLLFSVVALDVLLHRIERGDVAFLDGAACLPVKPMTRNMKPSLVIS